MVKHRLPKPRVASSSLVSRSRVHGVVAEWLGRGLQNLVQQFNSARRLHIKRARSSAGLEHYVDIVGVGSSSLFAPTIFFTAFIGAVFFLCAEALLGSSEAFFLIRRKIRAYVH